MIKIHFISPYPELNVMIEKAFNEHKRASILEKKLSTVLLNQLPDIKIDDCDVIISRGYSAKYVREHIVGVPIVDIDMTGYDVFRSVQECNQLYNPKKIAFIGFYSALSGVEEFSAMIGCKVKVYTPEVYEDIICMLKQAVEDGCDAVIGGRYIVDEARKMNINAIVIKTGKEAIERSIDEAIRTYEIICQERVKSKVYEKITNNAKDGIMYIDKNGQIQVVNKVALKLFEITHNTYTLAKDFKEFKEKYDYVMKNGIEVTGELKTINKITVSIDYVPVIHKKSIEGIVITFQSVTKVQEMEINIRKKLSEKGLFAKKSFEDIIYESEIVHETIEIAKRYARSSSNIMLVGETGTGKEIFAQSIHNASKRKEGPFVAVNCAALPENLLESELFGYVEGAFTGAVKKGKVGLFELAHNGTLFLDEIGELPMSMQSKLLRVLQEKEIRRIGDDKVVSIDVRIICATNKNLKSTVLKGEFRQDLLYRLDVLKIFIQPLRGRRKDIMPLFYKALNKTCIKNNQNVPKISEEGEKVLLEYNFPGNVRELKNIAERVNIIRLEEDVISKIDMERAIYPDDVGENIYFGEIEKEKTKVEDKNNEKEKILKALEDAEGSVLKAAKNLEIDRTTLWRKMQKYEIKK